MSIDGWLPPGVTDLDVDLAAADPEADDRIVGECDCCGRREELCRVWYGGLMETWACQRCRDMVP
jgi:hypothetical protein